MKVVDAIAEILKREGVEFLSTYPTTPIIDARIRRLFPFRLTADQNRDRDQVAGLEADGFVDFSQMKTININEAKVDVTYDGTPQFESIQETSMTYAVNTHYQVIYAAGQYYCCYQGVWFVSPLSNGPWVVCTVVPAVIYTIPPSSPE